MFVEQENNIFFEIENIYTIIMEKIAILGLQTLHLKIAMPPQLFGNMLVLNYLNYTLCITKREIYEEKILLTLALDMHGEQRVYFQS